MTGWRVLLCLVLVALGWSGAAIPAGAQQFTARPQAGVMNCQAPAGRVDRLFCTVLPVTIAGVTGASAEAGLGAVLSVSIAGTREAHEDTALLALVDHSPDASAFAISAMRADLEAVIRALPPESAVSLVLLAQEGEIGPFDTRDAALSTLARLAGGASSADALPNVLAKAVSALARRPEASRWLVILSDFSYALPLPELSRARDELRQSGAEVLALGYRPLAEQSPQVTSLSSLLDAAGGTFSDRTGLIRPGAEADLALNPTLVGRYVDLIIATGDGSALPASFRVALTFSDATRETFDAEALVPQNQTSAGNRTLELRPANGEPVNAGGATTSTQERQETGAAATPLRTSIMQVLGRWVMASTTRMIVLGGILVLALALIVLAVLTSRSKKDAHATSARQDAPRASFEDGQKAGFHVPAPAQSPAPEQPSPESALAPEGEGGPLEPTPVDLPPATAAVPTLRPALPAAAPLVLPTETGAGQASLETAAMAHLPPRPEGAGSPVTSLAQARLVWEEPKLGENDLARSTTAIGRHESDDIVVPDPTVSRQHVLILRLPDGGFEIVNRQAGRAKPNPIFINGKERAQSELVDGDEVRLGRAGVRFIFRLVSGNESLMKERPL